MKHSVKELLKDCPKHACAYVKYKNSSWTRVEEHELRYLELQVAKGELNPEDILIRESTGHYNKIESDGYLKYPLTSNIFTCSSELHREKIRINNQNKTEYC